MKKFILTVLTVFIFSGVILLFWAYLSTPHLDKIDFSVPKEKHIAVIGPSTTGCAIDDSRIPGYINISLDGAPFEVLKTYLPLFLKDNPQVDTVLISAGRFFIANQKDKPKGVQYNYRHLWPGWFMKYRPFFEEIIKEDAQIRKESLLNPNYYLSWLLPDRRFGFFQKDLNSIEGLGLGYENIKDRHSLSSSIKYYDEVCESRPQKSLYTSEELAEYYQNMVNELQAIGKICLSYDVVPVYIYTPLYQFDRWVKWNGLYEYLSQCDSTILIADYEDFTFPDESYYGDVQHLNEAGSQYFSDHLARNGLHTQTLGQWLEEHQQSEESFEKAINTASLMD